ncbi:hypothetical protein [Flavobacterium sp.]|uniref:hypothetical protein n=1 Tax=Flavobacterium sp. TaxID=239 RepID=UPI00286D7920|nr:hypothetical protein [Flavobacterium sp.]
MKAIIFSLFLLLPFFAVIAQEKGILLQNKNAEKSDFLMEHKRIKVVTTDGKCFYGRFSIIDNNTISINNTLITLSSIEKIKRKSLTATITAPIVCTLGVILILGGTGVTAVGGGLTIVGLGMISSGFTIPVIALISNKHPKNQWEYTVGDIPLN